MNPDVRADWVARLRSGRYRQGHGKLRRDSYADDVGGPSAEYCCLGVLCELAVEAGVAVRLPSTGDVTRYGDVAVGGEHDRSDSFLPIAVAHWAGLDTSNPLAGRCSLADWNDNRHASFERIADLIEEHL